jgi:hypothetical protein
VHGRGSEPTNLFEEMLLGDGEVVEPGGGGA